MRPAAKIFAVAVFVAAGFACGFLTAQSMSESRKESASAPNDAGQLATETDATESAPKKPKRPFARPAKGRFRLARLDSKSTIELDDAQLEAMRAIGYEAGTQPAPNRSGVTKHDRELAYPGINLVVDGHDSAAELIDMEGRSLHQWRLAFHDVFPDHELPMTWMDSVTFWRRARVLEDGSLLAIFEGVSLIKIDRDSNLLWSYPKAHHDLDVTDDGRIFVLTRDWLKFEQPGKKAKMIDFITVLDGEGRELDRVSIYEAIKQSPYSALLRNTRQSIEMFHTNTIEVLDGSLADRIPAFARGNVMVSLLLKDAIAVIDMKTRKVVWALTGIWTAQHQPTVTDDRYLMVFDNTGNRGRSRVVEIDPVTQQIEWMFEGDESGLFSKTCGSNQRLPNGNTLITESDSGRALEVTHDKQIVWEYLTPHRAGDHGKLIATLFEVVRLPPDFPTDWLPD